MNIPSLLLLLQSCCSGLIIQPPFTVTTRSILSFHQLRPSRISLSDRPESAEYDELAGSDIDADEAFLRQELSKLETLEEILDELEEFEFDGSESSSFEAMRDEDEFDNDQDLAEDYLWDPESLSELLSGMQDDKDKTEAFQDDNDDASIRQSAAQQLEQALLQGVVPVTATVGTNMLAGDFGFDPLNLATKDYFKQAQLFLLNLLPLREGEEPLPSTPPMRPAALILRDYRESEIRHARLCMLAAVFWPLQELLDRLILDDDQFGPLLYGPVTLPYFPLIMTAIMMLLGYLDIYSQAIKDLEGIGEAYMPGDCFWDPLAMLQGAPDSMKRRMQERELFNGRAAMLAVLAYFWEELVTRKPLIEIASNEILFTPAYQIPFVQSWLDSEFADTLDRSVDAMETIGETDIISSLI
ncbi:hypothetical protein MPSEU_000450900 [Mayamaea pseudoterrestris]|nr:hypothetical protein MPSEU_000450900 [Mayamaea pseudoterrestris]